MFRKTALKQLIKRVGEDGVAQLEELVAEMEKERKRRPAGFRYTADDAAINIRWIAQALAARADAAAIEEPPAVAAAEIKGEAPPPATRIEGAAAAIEGNVDLTQPPGEVAPPAPKLDEATYELVEIQPEGGGLPIKVRARVTNQGLVWPPGVYGRRIS